MVSNSRTEVYADTLQRFSDLDIRDRTLLGVKGIWQPFKQFQTEPTYVLFPVKYAFQSHDRSFDSPPAIFLEFPNSPGRKETWELVLSERPIILYPSGKNGSPIYQRGEITGSIRAFKVDKGIEAINRALYEDNDPRFRIYPTALGLSVPLPNPNHLTFTEWFAGFVDHFRRDPIDRH